MCLAHALPTLGAQPRLFSQLALRGTQMVFAFIAAAFGNLPRISPQRITILPHQINFIILNRQHANSHMFEMDDAINTRRTVRPDGAPGIYGVVHFKHVAIGVLAVEDDEVYLVGQYRYALGRYSWEIPEGGCDEGEDHLSAAQRELAEETGLRAERWQRMGEAHLSNSVSDELAVWFLAT